MLVNSQFQSQNSLQVEFLRLWLLAQMDGYEYSEKGAGWFFWSAKIQVILHNDKYGYFLCLCFIQKKKRRSKNFRVTTPKSGTTCICWTKGWLQQIFAQETLSASWRSFAIFGVDVNWIPSPSKQFLECLDINDVSGGWLWKSSLYILQYHNGWGIIPKEFINMSISILFQYMSNHIWAALVFFQQGWF